ncbi:hypothetical protein C8J56DRAFT_401604 [Mycena floridula]|nr:hypothetical protein C8J56DRAFT_401604 [Mycena floridula]
MVFSILVFVGTWFLIRTPVLQGVILDFATSWSRSRELYRDQRLRFLASKNVTLFLFAFDIDKMKEIVGWLEGFGEGIDAMNCWTRSGHKIWFHVVEMVRSTN